MKIFIDVLLDSLLDTVKLLPFLFVAFFIIELIEHKLSKKSSDIILKSGKFGPLLGGILGAIPQCGFSVLATNLYVTRILSLGTLIAIYLSTSDEMLPIMISDGVSILTILKIIGIKFFIGVVFGFIIDFVFRNKFKKNFSICEDEDCHCEKESIFISSLIHTGKTILFIFIVTFILGYILELGGEDAIKGLLKGSPICGPFIASLVGFIPNCASSVVLTELYLNDIITLGTSIAGLLTGSGIALLVLFKQNKDTKENLVIMLLLYLIGVLSGVVINLVGLFV